MNRILNFANSIFGRERMSAVETIVRFIDQNNRPGHHHLAACLDLGLRNRAEQIARLIPHRVSVDLKIRIALLRGDFEAALNFVEQSLNADKLRPKKTAHEVINLIAPVSPRKALSLARTARWSAPCSPALALATGELNLYRELEWQMARHLGPDKWLLSANQESSELAKFKLLNEYLSAFELTGLEPINSSRGLAVHNLAPINRALLGRDDGPLLSVVMTAFNCEHYIEASIRSVLEQTYRNIELIVVDDNSSDTTWKRISALSAKDTRIKAIRLAGNVGTYAAKNIGLEMTSGEYMAFQDADDWSHPERFSTCIRALSHNISLVAVSAMYVRLDDAGRFVSSKVWPLTRWTPNSIVFRRHDVMEKVGYFENVRFGADSEYVARIRAFFGEWRHQKLRVPLLIAAHREGSLMTAAGTGLDTHGYSEERMQYQEAWSERLIQNIRTGRSLYRENEK